MHKLLTMKDEGAWTVIHGFYYRCTHDYLAKYEAAIEKMKPLQEQARAEMNGMEEDVIRSYVLYETKTVREEAERAASATCLYACMTIEAFVNYYGVRRVGEAFYKQNLERLRPEQKFAVLVAICWQDLLLHDDDVLKGIKGLFEHRNSLIHAKTNEVNQQNAERFVAREVEDIDLKSKVNIMERFIDKLCEFDNDINKDAEFRKSET